MGEGPTPTAAGMIPKLPFDVDYAKCDATLQAKGPPPSAPAGDALGGEKAPPPSPDAAADGSAAEDMT